MFLDKKEVSEKKLSKFGEMILNSKFIVGCSDDCGKTGFIFVWNIENKILMPIFTDIDEFKKRLDEYKNEIYPKEYYFRDLLKVAEADFVINPAIESIVLNLEAFKLNDCRYAI